MSKGGETGKRITYLRLVTNAMRASKRQALRSGWRINWRSTTAIAKALPWWNCGQSTRRRCVMKVATTTIFPVSTAIAIVEV